MRQPLEEPEPRTIEQPCPTCHGEGTVTKLDGHHWAELRRKAKMTQVEMARAFEAWGEKVSVDYLSKMERGARPFREKYAAIYKRLLDRRNRSGQDW